MTIDCYLKPGGVIVKSVVIDKSVVTDNNILPVEGHIHTTLALAIV